MEKGNIASWKVKVGDKVKAGDVMAEVSSHARIHSASIGDEDSWLMRYCTVFFQVETDKATVAFESVEEGYIAKIIVQDGAQDVPVGTPVAVLAENEADIKAFEGFSGGAAQEAPKKAAAPAKEAAPAAQEAAAPAAAASSSSASSASSGARVIASPAARRVAGEAGVALDGIQGTGPNNRILQADVKEQAGSAKSSKAAAPSAAPAAKAQAAQPSSAGDFTDIPNSNVRKVIASRLSQSKQTIPHYYLSVDVTMGRCHQAAQRAQRQPRVAS